MGYDVNAIMDPRHEDCYQNVTEHHKHTHTPNLSRLYFLSVCSLVIQSLSMNVVGNVAQGKHLVIEISLYIWMFVLGENLALRSRESVSRALAGGSRCPFCDNMLQGG